MHPVLPITPRFVFFRCLGSRRLVFVAGIVCMLAA